MHQVLIQKANLRDKIRNSIHCHDATELNFRSLRLIQQLKRHLGNCNNKVVSLFGGSRHEPDLRPLIPWLIEQKARPVFFSFEGPLLIPRAVNDPRKLKIGDFGVWVPSQETPIVDYCALDIILTPGLAFDFCGHRLGWGHGHFDRLFSCSHVSAHRIGVCWNFQIVDSVPVEIHDVTMHEIITEIAVKPIIP